MTSVHEQTSLTTCACVYIWNGADNMKRYLMSGEESQPRIVVHCHEGSSRLEHINETEFAPIPLGSEAHEEWHYMFWSASWEHRSSSCVEY